MTRNIFSIARVSSIGALLIALGFSATVLAQAGPPGPDRSIVGYGAIPSSGATGAFDLFALVEVRSPGGTTPVDLGMELDWLLNGTSVGSSTQPATASFVIECMDPTGACGTPTECATWDFGSVLVDGSCRISPVTFDCMCGAVIAVPGPTVASLDPGDEIMVILFPSPGALPETNPSGDVFVQTFQDPVIVPNRELRALDVDVTAGVANVEVLVTCAPTTVAVDLGTEAVLHINGVPVSSSLHSFETTPASVGCGAPLPSTESCTFAPCFNWNTQAGSIGGNCYYSPIEEACGCSIIISETIPIPTTLEPGDEIMVLLRPTPGAIPETFEDDDLRVWSSPSGNRRALRIGSHPDPNDPSSVIPYAIWSVEASETSVPFDLSTEIEFLHNGLFMGAVTQTAIIGSATACTDPLGDCVTGSCGTWDIGGTTVDGFCRMLPGSAECRCGTYFITEGPPIPAATGDEIMIILYPTPGALPDDDSSDDVFFESYSEPNPIPNRTVLSAALVPSSVPGSLDVEVSWQAATGRSPFSEDLSTIVQVEVNGIVVAETLRQIQTVADPGFGQCEEEDCVSSPSCGDFMCPPIAAPIAGQCFFNEAQQTCACTIVTVTPIPVVPVDPDDEIVVILRPAPGALPELPGFDDEEPVEFRWNRRLIRLGCLPNPNGGVDTYAVVEVGSKETGGPIDLGFELDWYHEGDLHATTAHVAESDQVDDACFNPIEDCGDTALCSDWLAGNTIVPGVCQVWPASQNCLCTTTLVIAGPTIPAVLPNDEILVILRPAPGALPELDASEDSLAKLFDGPNPIPNRAIIGVEVEPTGTAHDSFFDVFICLEAQTGASPESENLSTKIEFRVNGVTVASQLFTLIAPPSLDSCDVGCDGEPCGTWMGQGSAPVAAQCRYSDSLGTCACSVRLEWSPGVPVRAEDEIMVLLRPAPGALPDVLPEDDIRIRRVTPKTVGTSRPSFGR